MAKSILYVLDTNVLMHDPLSIFRFEEHDIFICSTVLEELDRNKKGLDTPQRNARMVLNFIDELIEKVEPVQLGDGVVLSGHKQAGNARGRMFFEDDTASREVSGTFIENTGDNRIIQTVRDIRRRRFKDTEVILVSQDTNMRIKCKIEGITCERYLTDFIASDADIFYSGIERLPDGYFKDLHVDYMRHDGGDHYYLPLDAEKKLLPGTMLVTEGASAPFKRGYVRTRNNDIGVCVLQVWGYSNGHKAFNIHERNEEQGLALWALMNPDIDLVVLSGPAGTGKTLLTLAAGLEQTISGSGREIRYDDLMFVCGLNPVGKKDIGFLPGSKEEKLEPWMGAVKDNLDVLFHPVTGMKDCKRQDVEEFMAIEAVMHTRGRTLHRRYLVIDEGQNYTAHEMRTLITRAGDGTKVVVLGNNAQIDNPYVSVHTNGFSYLISQFRGTENFAHVMLKGGVRSRLAQRANELLQ
jgi:PhoH-like ATPase